MAPTKAAATAAARRAVAVRVRAIAQIVVVAVAVVVGMAVVVAMVVVVPVAVGWRARNVSGKRTVGLPTCGHALTHGRETASAHVTRRPLHL